MPKDFLHLEHKYSSSGDAAMKTEINMNRITENPDVPDKRLNLSTKIEWWTVSKGPTEAAQNIYLLHFSSKCQLVFVSLCYCVTWESVCLLCQYLSKECKCLKKKSTVL